MFRCNQATAAVLDILTARLEPGESRKIDNSNGLFMPVYVEALGSNRFSVAHYYTQNGDMVADPDGEFFKTARGTWLAVALQQCTGHYTCALEFDGEDDFVRHDKRAHRELSAFAKSGCATSSTSRAASASSRNSASRRPVS